jgi:hypothetical protein
LGFLFPILFFNERMASLGCTVLDRITSEISRLRGISSLHCISMSSYSWLRKPSRTYKLEVVARSICSSSALLVDDPNQPAMVSGCARLSYRLWCFRSSPGFLTLCAAPNTGTRDQDAIRRNVVIMAEVFDGGSGSCSLGPHDDACGRTSTCMHHRGRIKSTCATLDRRTPHTRSLHRSNLPYTPLARRPCHRNDFQHQSSPSPTRWASTHPYILVHTDTLRTRERPIYSGPLRPTCATCPEYRVR